MFLEFLGKFAQFMLQLVAPRVLAAVPHKDAFLGKGALSDPCDEAGAAWWARGTCFHSSLAQAWGAPGGRPVRAVGRGILGDPRCYYLGKAHTQRHLVLASEFGRG